MRLAFTLCATALLACAPATTPCDDDRECRCRAITDDVGVTDGRPSAYEKTFGARIRVTALRA